MDPTTQFSRMDELSLAGRPFLFFVDFLLEQVLVYPREALVGEDIWVRFPGFSYPKKTPAQSSKSLDLQSFPQSFTQYEKGFTSIHNHIQKGNSYLVNYTCCTPIQCTLDFKELFSLAEATYKVRYKDDFLFFSPEPFVQVESGRISTYPMKGTIDAALPNAKELLRGDEKEKAEHYTVVDLLRNDLSMVANEVEVAHFQKIDLIKTNRKNLYAMSSEIVGRVKPEYDKRIGALIARLLPAGSILGAPKDKTLQIIKEAENYARGFYTGVCGYFDGENLDSCVMIRFMEQHQGALYFKSGGGITGMSTAASEYQEMINKIYVPIS